MNLFLHWLLWDLRRFRLMLLAWTLLVAGYAAYLGWVHWNILTVDPAVMAWSGPGAKFLGFLELLMILHLFSTDPSGGTDAFWKTRPPAGFAVAGSKLVVAGVFFLILPLGAWLAMSGWCVKPGAVTQEWEEGISWTRFLWMAQTLVVGVLALGAAAIRTPWQIPLRLGAGFAMILAPIFCVLFIKSNGLKVAEPVAARIGGRVVSPLASWGWLLVGCGVYFLVKCRRTPFRSWPLAVAVAPALLAAGFPLLPAYQPTKEGVLETAVTDPGVVDSIKVKDTTLRRGGPCYQLTKPFLLDETYPWGVYGMSYQVTGLPDGLPPDGAGWLDLKLTAPDGRVVRADATVLRKKGIKREGGVSVHFQQPIPLHTCFPAKEAEALAMLPCRAEGTMRIFLQGRASKEIPLQPETLLETPPAWYSMVAGDFVDSRWMRSMASTPRVGAGWLQDYELVNLTAGGTIRLSPREVTGASGFLILSNRREWSFFYSPDRGDLKTLRLLKGLEDGVPPESWQMRFTWSVPKGYVDVPVSWEPVVLPKLRGGPIRNWPEIIAAVPLPPDAPPDRVKVAVEHVLTLVNQASAQFVSDRDMAQALEQWLNRTTEAHLPVLLEIARENLPGSEPLPKRHRHLDEAPEEGRMDGPLSRRIAALMKPSDVDPIRTAEPTLFKYLGTALAAVGLISVEETKPVEPRVLTDQALAEGWERGGEDGKLPIDLLAEAAARGLPWSMAAIAEVWELIHPYDDRDRDRIRDFMIGISDCPQERGKALPWIRKNALQLVWDAERKRWVLPEGTGK